MLRQIIPDELRKELMTERGNFDINDDQILIWMLRREIARWEKENKRRQEPKGPKRHD